MAESIELQQISPTRSANYFGQNFLNYSGANIDNILSNTQGQINRQGLGYRFGEQSNFQDLIERNPTSKPMASVASSALLGSVGQGMTSGANVIGSVLQYVSANKQNQTERYKIGQAMDLQHDILNFSKQQWSQDWAAARAAGLSSPAQFTNIGSGAFYSGRNTSVLSPVMRVPASSPYSF